MHSTEDEDGGGTLGLVPSDVYSLMGPDDVDPSGLEPANRPFDAVTAIAEDRLPIEEQVVITPMRDSVSRLIYRLEHQSPEDRAKFNRFSRGENKKRFPTVVANLTEALTKVFSSNSKVELGANLVNFGLEYEVIMKQFSRSKGNLPQYLKDLIDEPVRSLVKDLFVAHFPDKRIAVEQADLGRQLADALTPASLDPTSVREDVVASVVAAAPEVLEYSLGAPHSVDAPTAVTAGLLPLDEEDEDTDEVPQNFAARPAAAVLPSVTMPALTPQEEEAPASAEPEAVAPSPAFLENPPEITMPEPVRKLTPAELFVATKQEMIAKGIFADHQYNETLDEFLKEYDFSATSNPYEEGSLLMQLRLDRLYRFIVSEYAKKPFELGDDEAKNKEIWLGLFKQFAARHGIFQREVKPVDKKMSPYGKTALLRAAAGALFTLGGAVQSFYGAPQPLVASAEPVAELAQKASEAAPTPSVKAPSAPIQISSQVAWDYMKTLENPKPMAEVLVADPVTEYLEANSSIVKKLDNPRTFASIKAELMDEGFRGAFEMAPEATTIRECLTAVEAKNAGVAKRLKSEILSFGLNKEQLPVLNALVKAAAEGK